MEMERINANTIRVMLGNDDLAQRGITVLDLLGNHKQMRASSIVSSMRSIKIIRLLQMKP